jgi:hypothetical protein
MNGQIGISARGFGQAERQQCGLLMTSQGEISQGKVTQRSREGKRVATGRLSGFS